MLAPGAVSALAALAAVLPEGLGSYAVLMGLGFAVGAYGHLIRSKWVVAIGVIMIFLATLLFPLAIHVFEDEPSAPPGPQLEP